MTLMEARTAALGTFRPLILIDLPVATLRSIIARDLPLALKSLIRTLALALPSRRMTRNRAPFALTRCAKRTVARDLLVTFDAAPFRAGILASAAATAAACELLGVATVAGGVTVPLIGSGPLWGPGPAGTCSGGGIVPLGSVKLTLCSRRMPSSWKSPMMSTVPPSLLCTSIAALPSELVFMHRMLSLVLSATVDPARS